MHAIIMAGGEGRRLRPITCDAPKPLVSLLGRPVIEYTIALAAQHGITDIGVTLGYQGEKIERALGDGARWGVKLHYNTEKMPLGTAGGVREAAKALDEAFFVLSGDAVTDCDLTAAMKLHREKRAIATIVLARCKNPQSYGVVVTDRSGRVERFCEKPSPDEALSDQVSTGMYILEPEALQFVPQGRAFDFGRELFPLLLRMGKPVQGYLMQGYWRDMGDVESHIGACADLLDGKVRHPLMMDEGNSIDPDARVSEAAQITAPCFIGAGAQIAPGARIGPHAVIEAGARVMRGARVERSVLLRDVRVEAGAQLSGAVACEGAILRAGAQMQENSVLGEDSVLEEEAALLGGVRVWPGKRVEAAQRVTEDVVWGDCRGVHVKDGLLQAQSVEEAAHGACAWAQVSGAKRIALMHAGSARARMLLKSAAAQLNACGVTCYDLGSGSEAMLRVHARMLDAQAAIFFKKQHLALYDAHQCPPTRAQQRTMELGHEALRPQHAPAPSVRIRGAQAYYLAHLCRAADREALLSMQPYGVIACAKKEQAKLVRTLMAQLGLENMRVCVGESVPVRSYETGFSLSSDGKTVTISDSRGRFSAPQMALLSVMALLEKGEKEIVLGAHTPQAAQALCRTSGSGFVHATGEGEAFERALYRHAAQRDFYADGMYALLCLLSCFVRARTIPRALLETRVQAAFYEKEAPCAHAYASRVLAALSKDWKVPWERGAVNAFLPRGNVTLYASGGGGIRVLAQSRDTETARELCGDVLSAIRAKRAEIEPGDPCAQNASDNP